MLVGALSLFLLPLCALADIVCNVDVGLGNQWVNAPNGTDAGVLELTVSNAGFTNVSVPWELTVENPLYLDAPQVWNLETVKSGRGYVNGTAVQYWEALLPNSTTAVNLGMVLEFNRSNVNDIIPTRVTAAGAPCTIKIVTNRVNASPTTAGNTTPNAATGGAPTSANTSPSPASNPSPNPSASQSGLVGSPSIGSGAAFTPGVAAPGGGPNSVPRSVPPIAGAPAPTRLM